jgi:hypothetical protein
MTSMLLLTFGSLDGETLCAERGSFHELPSTSGEGPAPMREIAQRAGPNPGVPPGPLRNDYIVILIYCIVRS